MHRIPPFEGHDPENTRLSLTGNIDDETLQPVRALKLGDPVVMVVFGEVTGVNHPMKGDGTVIRAAKVKVTEAHEVRGTEASDLLAKYKKETEKELAKWVEDTDVLGVFGTTKDTELMELDGELDDEDLGLDEIE